MLRALIVDDDPEALQLLADLVDKHGFTTTTAASLAEARETLTRDAPDVVLLDLMLPDGRGLELLEEPAAAESEVVLVTGHASIDTAIESLRAGVADYLVKPVDVPRLEAVLARVARSWKLRQEIQGLREELRDLGRFGGLVGLSPEMQEVCDRIERVAPTDATVFVTGESGTGKELVARTVHELSRRKDGPFLALNCGGVAPELVQSELFGHEKGAFTGAHKAHRGYFERASGGTLLLDEISEMPAELQVKLLRTLESEEVTPVGGEERRGVDVRVVAASNRRPETLVDGGHLREDLYFRLNVFWIHLPPLRAREGDVELLVRYFLDGLNRESDERKRLTDAALEVLSGHEWPGNVRELKNVVRSAWILADEVIDVEHLPIRAGGLEEGDDAPTIEGPPEPAISVPLGSSVAQAERDLILATLEHCDGVKTRAAETLGISPRTLYNRLQEYGLHGDGSEPDGSGDTESGGDPSRQPDEPEAGA